MNPIKGYEGIYSVDENGRVFSHRTKKYLRPGIDRYGYEYYVFCVNGVRKTEKAHRLVAETYLENPHGKKTVDHINGIKKDNRVSNLRWATSKENKLNPATLRNAQDVARENIKKAYGTTDFGRKKVSVIKDGIITEYPSLLSAAAATGANYGHLSEVLNGKRPQRKDFQIHISI